MKQYDTYKDSGIEWIGEIPEHWEVKKFGRISYMKGRIGWQGLKQAEFTKNGEDPFLITGMNFHDGKIRWDEVYHFSEERYYEAPEIQLKENDVLITKDGTIGKLLYVDAIPYPHKASLNSHLLVLRPLQNSYYPRYLYYVLQSLPFKHHIELTKTGTTFFGITQEAMGQFKILMPLISEQTAIATYLDRKTAEIDELIADKKRMLELYEEEKTAIINQAVTKGINPDVPLKDSGIEWLGEIPNHWEVKRLSWCFQQVGSGTTPRAGVEQYYSNGEVNWLLTGDLNDKEIFETTKKITQKAVVEHTSLRIYPVDSIVIAMYGATIGKLGILKVSTTVNQACCVISNPIYHNYLFVFYYLLAARRELINLSYGGGQPNISQELIKSFKILVPPLKEQHAIVHHIETECSRIDTQIERTKKLIELLTEYRTALISEVVTGKVKVID